LSGVCKHSSQLERGTAPFSLSKAINSRFPSYSPDCPDPRVENGHSRSDDSHPIIAVIIILQAKELTNLSYVDLDRTQSEVYFIGDKLETSKKDIVELRLHSMNEKLDERFDSFERLDRKFNPLEESRLEVSNLLGISY
jgi:hypothetical protein